MFDRTIPPAFKEIQPIDFPWPELHMLKNQLPLYLLSGGSQPIIEIELVFQSGSAYEMCAGAACFTAAMLLEGTTCNSAQAIAQVMDYYGATIDVHTQADFCSITLTTLSEHLLPILELLLELLLKSNFPQKSLTLLKNLQAQAIQMADQQPSRVAHKRFFASIFTQAHPYGRFLSLEDIAALQVEDLYNHYAHLFFADCAIFVSGEVTPEALYAIKESLAALPYQKTGALRQLPAYHSTESAACTAAQQQLQSAIVIGKQFLLKKDADFLPMLVVTELLGGSFCSRLMQNLREDKGYTYGIYARMVALQQAGYLAIATEVAQEVTHKALQEIYKEIAKLQHELVLEKELQKIKNHLLGRFLTTINDPFSLMQKFQAAYLHRLDQQYYTAFYRQVADITPTEIRSLAQKYLSSNTLTEVVVR